MQVCHHEYFSKKFYCCSAWSKAKAQGQTLTQRNIVTDNCNKYSNPEVPNRRVDWNKQEGLGKKIPPYLLFY